MIDILDERTPQRLQIDIAGLHHLRGVGIVEQRQKQVLKRRVFVMAVAREFYRPVEHLLEAARQRWHLPVTPFPLCTAEGVDASARIQSPGPPWFQRPRR